MKARWQKGGMKREGGAEPRKAAQMRGRGESKMSQRRRKTVLGSEGWEEKCNLGPDGGVTVQFVCGVMERRWLGSADKSGPAWTGRIRGDLRSVCKIFRWTDVWRGQEGGRRGPATRRPVPASQRRPGCFWQDKSSLAESPGRIPKTRRRVRKQEGKMEHEEVLLSCVSSVVSLTVLWHHIPPAARRLVKGHTRLLVHLQLFSLPLYASLQAGKEQHCGGLVRLFFWLTGSVRLGMHRVALIVWKCRRFRRSPAGQSFKQHCSWMLKASNFITRYTLPGNVHLTQGFVHDTRPLLEVGDLL